MQSPSICRQVDMNDLEFFSATRDNTTYFKDQFCTFTLNGCQQTGKIETFVENIKVSFSVYFFFYEWFMLKYWIVKLFYSSCNNMYMDGWIKECIKSLYVKNYIVPARVCKFFQQIAAKLIPILTSKDILANLGWKLEWTCMIT